MPEVTFPVELINGVPVVSAPEEIDVTNAAGLRSVLVEVTSGSATVVVDMSRTQFCDSAGLNVLVRAHQRTESLGGQVRLVISTPDVRRIFAIIGMDRVISSFPDLEQALARTPPVAIHPPAAS